jgi:actin-like ATPase involved in cell morphogenesis
VYLRGKGIIIDEPSVAINNKTRQILAIGDEAAWLAKRQPTS